MCFLVAGLFDTELDQSSQLVTNASILRSVVQISWLRGLGRHENRRLLPQKSVLSVWPWCRRLFLPCCWCQMLTLRKATSDIDLFISSTGECGRSASSRLELPHDVVFLLEPGAGTSLFVQQCQHQYSGPLENERCVSWKHLALSQRDRLPCFGHVLIVPVSSPAV